MLARLLVRLRWLVVAAWVAGAIVATSELPAIGETGAPAIGGLVPEDAESINAERRQLEHFAVPLVGRTVVVHRDPDGLGAGLQRQLVTRALEVTFDERAGRPEDLLLALPATNALGLFPGAREEGTTVVTYLVFRPGESLTGRHRGAQAYVESLPTGDEALVGVTGSAEARHVQGTLIFDALPVVTAAAAALVALVFALAFRAPLAAAVPLVAAGFAYVVAVRVAGGASEELGLTAPEELRPVVVALILGVVTDYAVFQMSGTRRRMTDGATPRDAVAQTLRDVGPIIVTAGTIVALGVLSLMVGRLDFFRAFGPGLAISVAVTVLAGVTLIPALLAILGRATFWPRAGARVSGPPPRGWRAWLLDVSTSRPGALVAALLATALLLGAASGLRDLELGFTAISSLPRDNDAARAADAAARGFAPGVVAPTVLLLEGDGLGDRRAQLARLERRLGELPGVAGVLGPGEQPRGVEAPVFVAPDAARYVLVLDRPPLGAPAIERLEGLRRALPPLLDGAGLEGVGATFAGDTALARETIELIEEDLLRVGVVAVLVNLGLLALLLRAIVAPLYLVAASALSLAAALGLTVTVFQGLLGFSEITYYVPFAVAVLSLSLGSDYNLFLAGRVWQESQRRALRDAVSLVTPRARRAIAVAGLTLAGSFGLLALVPLRSFREFAFAMGVGVLLDTYVVRPLLVPSLIVLFGRSSWWPGRRHRAAVPADPRAVGGGQESARDTQGPGAA